MQDLLIKYYVVKMAKSENLYNHRVKGSTRVLAYRHIVPTAV